MPPLGEVIGKAIKQSLNGIQASLDKIAKKSAAAPYDIAGLRDQIIENACLLYPLIYSSKRGVPTMNVATIGCGTTIRASVVYDGSDEAVYQLAFIESENAGSTGQALEKLLEGTQTMLKDEWKGSFYSPRESNWRRCGRNGGYYDPE